MKRLSLFCLFCLGMSFSMRAFAQCAEKLGALPSLAFKGTASTLDGDHKKMLSLAAKKLRENPGCRITITGYCKQSKRMTTIGYGRAEAVRNYLVEREGITAERIAFLLGQDGGDCSTVDLKPE